MSFVRGHALLIGIGSYQYRPELNVPITAADARELAGVLHDPRFCGYPESQISVLRDSGATRDRILQALDVLAARIAEQDTVLLFYCGHGDYGEDGQYYLTCHDTRFVDRKVAQDTGVSQRDLVAKIQAIPAKRVLLIFNACHSGAVTPTLGTAPPFAGQNPPEAISSALLATGEGRVIITACRASQLSYIGGGARTIFTQALVDGLQGVGVSGRAGYISAFDLYTYVYTTVNARVCADFQAVQEPELTIVKGVGPFAVALYRGTTALGEFDARAEAVAGLAVREVEPEESRTLLRQIQHGGIDFGQNNTVAVQGSVVGGSQHNIRVGGDYTRAGILDQRQGVSISGGAITGPVVGFNQGSFSIAAGSPSAGALAEPLRDALARVEQEAARAQRRGDEDLALDLQSIILSIRAALKAQQDANIARWQAKVREAHTALRGIAAVRSDLDDVIRALERLQ